MPGPISSSNFSGSHQLIREGARLVSSVADILDDLGIKKEDMSKLFKLFGFLDTTKELNTKGIGLGLHISKKIC